MAIRFICEIALHLLQHTINCVFGVDVPPFFEIFLFEVVVEIFKYFTLEPQLSSPSDTAPLVPLKQLAASNGNNSTPVVRSIIIDRICPALDSSVELAPFEETGDIQTPSRNVRKKTPIPAVYSTTVFKIYEALDLKAELRPETERPTFVIKKKRFIPVVRSRIVFSFCQALELPAQLAEF
ncbi:hypothetical protein NPIL_234131 [Nephila pilipes]|uniref:Uncharacterized protein n=1 Tax=Nephila pilipes TaxID=299642 RepID=A0A8X6N886_NEPPI|nr:hypothetical protein NPIL_444881 [Nephila pilipes]GFT85599.1 hypothetical protein NPIL_234131 [Nephila pilipes]